MSLQEAGAYVRLMCIEWNEAGKGIPDNAVKCAHMVGATDAHMKRMWVSLRRCFQEHPTEPNMLIHPRLEKERAKQAAYRRRQSDKGAKGAAKRWPGDSTGMPPAIAQAIPNDSSPISNLQSPKVVPKEQERHTPARPPKSRLFGAEHREHAACGRACVPSFLHRQFLTALGGDESVAYSRLLAWYSAVEDSFGPNDPVPADVLKFWRKRFDVEFVTPVAAVKSEQQQAAELAEEIARQNARVAR